MAYLLAAFSWWAVLLTQKNQAIYELKKTKENLTEQELVDIEKEFSVSKKMIWGEGSVFAISILLGLLFINRGFWSEIKANKKLNNFLLSITHELKTPIASLKLINRTLANKSISPEKTKDLLDTAYDESNRLESLINNILTAARMESGLALNLEEFDIINLIVSRVNRFQNIHPLAQIIFESDIEYYKLPIDKEAFIKIIDNLIDNAIKYSTPLAPVEVNIKKTVQGIDIFIKDQGKGISDQDKKRIIEKFYRVGNEDTRESKGTGLGLYIVNELTKAHGGQLSILDNTPNGSIFIISFK